MSYYKTSKLTQEYYQQYRSFMYIDVVVRHHYVTVINIICIDIYSTYINIIINYVKMFIYNK